MTTVVEDFWCIITAILHLRLSKVFIQSTIGRWRDLNTNHTITGQALPIKRSSWIGLRATWNQMR